MRKNLEKAIKNAFNPPKPVLANSFILSLKTHSKGRLTFFISQLFYIRRSTFALFFAIILLSIFVLNTNSQENVYWIISIIPFCVLPLFLELSRSIKYNMVELELSCKYNLRQIILTRFTVLGGAGILFLAIIAPITAIVYSSWLLVLGSFVSFFLASAICLLICEKGACNELLYALAPAMVSAFWSVTFKALNMLTQTESFMLLIVAFVALVLFCTLKVIKIIKLTEELPCLQ